MSEMSEVSFLTPKCQLDEEKIPTLLKRNKEISEESCIIPENQLVEQINLISSEINQETCNLVEEISPLSEYKNIEMSKESCVSNENELAGETSNQTLKTIKEICGESSSTIGSELMLETIPQLVENKQQTCEGPSLGKQNQLTGETSSQSLETITIEIELILDKVPKLAGINQEVTPKIQLIVKTCPALIGSIQEVSTVNQTLLLKVKTRSETLDTDQGTPKKSVELQKLIRGETPAKREPNQGTHEKSFMCLQLNEESTPSKAETNHESHDKLFMPLKLVKESTPTKLQENQGTYDKSFIPLELNEESTPAKTATNQEAPEKSFMPPELNKESTPAKSEFIALEQNEESTIAKLEVNQETPEKSFVPLELKEKSTPATLDTNKGTYEKLSMSLKLIGESSQAKSDTNQEAYMPFELNEESTPAKPENNQEATEKSFITLEQNEELTQAKSDTNKEAYIPFELNEESTPAKPETNQEATEKAFIPLGQNEELTQAKPEPNKEAPEKLVILLEQNEESTQAKSETNHEAPEKSLTPQKESSAEKIESNQTISGNGSVISKSKLIKEQILESIDNNEVTYREPSMTKMQLPEEPSETLLESNKELSTTPHSQSKIQPELKGYQMVGDSQFCRFGEQLLGLKRVPIANSPGRIGMCVSGQTIAELHKRVKDKFYPISDKIILMIGTNDFLKNNDVTVMCHELSELVKTLQETVSSIIILTLPPIPRLGKRNITEHTIMIEKYNQYIRSLRDGDKIKVADISPMYVTPEPFQCRMNLFEKYFQGGRRYDLTHLNLKGLEVIRNYILENL